MEILGALAILLGLLLLVVGAIWIIVATIRSRPKRFPGIVALSGVVLFILGVILSPSSQSDSTPSEVSDTPATARTADVSPPGDPDPTPAGSAPLSDVQSSTKEPTTTVAAEPETAGGRMEANVEFYVAGADVTNINDFPWYELRATLDEKYTNREHESLVKAGEIVEVIFTYDFYDKDGRKWRAVPFTQTVKRITLEAKSDVDGPYDLAVTVTPDTPKKERPAYPRENSPKFKSVSAGKTFNCGVTTDRSVRCWGDDTFDQSDPPAGSFKSVSAGQTHSCGTRIDGSAECWGSSAFDQLDSPADTFVSVSAGGLSSCGVTIEGSVKCWGVDELGKLDVPEGIFKSVSTGWTGSCGIRTDGSVECWGNNEFDQLSPPGGAFTSVSTGGLHSCGVREDGAVECWGSGAFGPLNPPDGPFVSVSTGNYHACAVGEDGSVECWGSEDYGGTNPYDESFKSVSSGFSHSCGIMQDGYVKCWGADSKGELSVPQQ